MFISYISILLLFLFIHHGEFAITATAVLYRNESNVTGGTLTIVQNNGDTPVSITGTLSGFNDSTVHGFHVHTYPVSEPFPNCAAAGEHFNPYNTSHGPPTADIAHRHVGDLGNVTANANGIIYVNIIDSIIQLYNATQSIINRTIIVHAMMDDGGNTSMNNSATTGNSGARIMCGLIKLVSNTTTSTAILNTKPTRSILSMTIIFSYMFFY